MLWRRRGGLVPVLRRIIRPMGPKGRFVPLGGAPPSPEVRQCKPEQRASDAGCTRTHKYIHTHTHAHAHARAHIHTHTHIVPCPPSPTLSSRALSHRPPAPPVHATPSIRRPPAPQPVLLRDGQPPRSRAGNAFRGGQPSTQYGRLSLGEALNYWGQDEKIQTSLGKYKNDRNWVFFVFGGLVRRNLNVPFPSEGKGCQMIVGKVK